MSCKALLSRYRYTAVVAVLIAISIMILLWRSSVSQQSSQLATARLAKTQQRWADAESLARSWLDSHPTDVEGMLVLADALQHLGSLSEALDVYRKIPDDARSSGTATLAMTSLLLRQGRLSEAEAKLRSLNIETAQSPDAEGLWATLLTLSGRQWEANPFLFRTLNKFGDRLTTLISLANPAEMPAPPQPVFAQMMRARDPLGLLGCAKIAASVGRKEQAISLLRESLAQRPDLVEIQLTLAALYLDTGNEAGFNACFERLPQGAQHHPNYWLLMARRAEESDQRGTAIRCYWEVLRCLPDYDRATYQLGQLLSAEGQSAEAQLFTDRAIKLNQLTEFTARLYDEKGSSADLAACAGLTFELGRLPECKAWCELIPADTRTTDTEAILTQISEVLHEGTPALQDESNLAAKIDLSSFPLPDWGSLRHKPHQSKPSPNQRLPQISFADEALMLGLEFVYFNGEISSQPGKRMFEYTGGGVAALDYDLDGWCDLYFTQGTTWPPAPSNLQFSDALFRNQAGHRMDDVHRQAGIHDLGFGQGVSSADFDNDGFPDLYVANIDGNRLYKNQGDGTFNDVTNSSGLATHRHWTTTCLMVDLDDDSLPDVYDVTFLDGPDVFSRICRGDDGRPRSCAPAGFDAAEDHVYRNRGDGTFVEMTQEWGFDVPQGDGLGIVAGDFDNSGTISLFVGNDGRANFFFVPEKRSDGTIRWQELGLVSGLAYDDSGAAQACMGIAAGDPNNDGRIDLFVTNFYNESNTLYLNLGGKTFTDRARATGLRDPSWSMLGFGTQFLDADRDGWEDLVLVNGHVDDFTHKQIPYKMRPQFFQNHNNRFSEKFAQQIGPFFEQPRLGRGLARLDWNRDGLNDLAISHIGDPAALLTNRTAQPGRGIGLRLVGTGGSRDAIGTRVTLKVGSHEWNRQLTAGDGYQATNQKRIEFPITEQQEQIQIQIHWRGGNTQSFQLPADQTELIAIQGRQQLLGLSREIE